jgi:drug/metabolite transporter (DMT)-like permease
VGLTQTDGATASLLLNVGGVMMPVLASLVFKEKADLQIVLCMVAIVAGGVLLSWEPGAASLSTGAVLIAGACLAWATDNNLTRKGSTNDAMVVAWVTDCCPRPATLGWPWCQACSFLRFRLWLPQCGASSLDTV